MNMTRHSCESLSSPDLEVMVNVSLSVLLTMKLSLIGVISDSTVALQVSTLVPRLSRDFVNVVMYSTHDITDTKTMKSYIDVTSRRSSNTASLVLSANFNETANVFQTFSTRYGTKPNRQTGIEFNSKWLTILPCGVTKGQLEDVIGDFINVAAVMPSTALSPGEAPITIGDAAPLHIMTLVIKPEGGRFQSIGVTDGWKMELTDGVYPNVDRGFNKRHFDIGVAVFPPFTMREDKDNVTTYTGFCMDLLAELAWRMNFTLREAPDKAWGSLKPDGNWTGLIGMLQYFEVDMVVAPITPSPEREVVMDASFPFYYDKVGVIYRRPDPRDSLWKTFLHPFRVTVYYCIAASLVIGAVVYIVLGVVTSSCNTHARKDKPWKQFISEANAHIGVLSSALIQHGEPILPQLPSRRVFLSFWWLFSIIMAATYRGNLTAFLLVTKDDVPFQTLNDLAEQDKFTWGVYGSSAVEQLFSVSQRPDFRKIGDGLERFKEVDPDTNSMDSDVHLKKVKAGHYAFIGDMVPMEIWMMEDCELRLLKETVIPLPFVVSLPNQSAYVTDVNEQLLDIDQMGLYQVWKDRWWPKGTSCASDQRHGTKVVSVLDAQSAFYILCLGALLSILALVLELVWTNAWCQAMFSYVRAREPHGLYTVTEYTHGNAL